MFDLKGLLELQLIFIYQGAVIGKPLAVEDPLQIMLVFFLGWKVWFGNGDH